MFCVSCGKAMFKEDKFGRLVTDDNHHCSQKHEVAKQAAQRRGVVVFDRRTFSDKLMECEAMYRGND